MAAIVAATGDLHAQYAQDALRFSFNQPASTARFSAMAGAFTGIGGDLSSVNGNPAGLGLFTKSEFSITPEFNNYNADAMYLGQLNTGTKDMVNLNHAAVVWHNKFAKPKGSDLETGWISSNFGISYSKDNDFHQNINYSGTNGTNSVADFFSESANKYYGAPSSLTSGSLERMAYDNYLIGYDSQGYFPETDVNNIQSKTDMRLGSQSDINFATGLNYSNMIYVGASIGLSNLKYTSDAEYKESGYNVTEDNNYSLSFRQNQYTTGNGVHGKLGVIVRPNQFVRLGANIETPTWYTIDDSYSEVLDTEYGRNGIDSSYVNNVQDYNFSYKLRTPLKLSGGIGFFINNQGFISADVDYVGYQNIRFTSVDNANLDVISDNNLSVRENYKNAVNYRVGAEYKLSSLMLRAGYGIKGSPYKSADVTDALKTETVSAGLGYRINNYYIDLAYQNVNYNSNYKPYTLSAGNGPRADVKNSVSNVFLTIGSKF